MYVLSYFYNNTVELQPIFVNENQNTKCVITGRFNHLCRKEHIKKREDNSRYKNYYRCYKRAKCVYENGKCRGKKTRKYKKCIKKIRKAFSNYYYYDYYYY